jgi:hypothetical protein
MVEDYHNLRYPQPGVDDGIPGPPPPSVGLVDLLLRALQNHHSLDDVITIDVPHDPRSIQTMIE